MNQNLRHVTLGLGYVALTEGAGVIELQHVLARRAILERLAVCGPVEVLDLHVHRTGERPLRFELVPDDEPTDRAGRPLEAFAFYRVLMNGARGLDALEAGSRLVLRVADMSTWVDRLPFTVALRWPPFYRSQCHTSAVCSGVVELPPA